MKNKIKSKMLKSTNPEINTWAQLYRESLSDKELNENVTTDDIINNIFSTILYFLNNEGNIVLKDTDWQNYLINDIDAAIRKGLFKPESEDIQRIEKIKDSFYK